MGVYRNLEFQPVTDPRDPDDWRPDSMMSFVADPDADVAVFAEKLAPGDAIPLHRHRIDEVVLYLTGEGELHVGEETYAVRAGDIAVIPAGRSHGMRNVGESPVEFRAFFPSARVDVEYVERNPAPGTEGDAAQSPFVVDLHTGALEPRD
jgi:quercetin dioxygenase-like cupin family protein